MHEVPWKTWGTGTSRTIEDFCRSLQEERVAFRDWTQRPLIIDVHSAVVTVRYNDHGHWLELYEEYQVFKLTGQILKRKLNGIAETVKNNETVEETAVRCIAEELGFTEWAEYQLKPHPEKARETWEPMPSEKWPRIWAAYHRHMFDCQISERLFNPEGYVEHVDGTREIHFKWKPVATK